MFEQHPVPQQISSYQFRLVGDMTLKQFFQLAAGAVLGLLVYASPIPSLFKWPLIIFFVLMGAAFAFLPLQERPLEEWISAFFRAVYGPTLFRWKKDSNVQYFASAQGAPAVLTDINNQKPSSDPSITKLEAKENSFLTNLTDLFSLHPKTQTPSPALSTTALPITPQPPQAPTQIAPASVVAPLTDQQPQARVVTVNTTPSPLPIQSAPTPKAGTLFVSTPNAGLVSTTRVGFSMPTAPIQVQPVVTSPVSQTLPSQTVNMGVQVKFSPDAAPPSPATIPNVIVGQVMDSKNKIVEGAILEITDFQGRPVRALKTNKAGHFMIVTPLPNGKYKLTVEKEGLQFEELTFEVRGALIEPMAIMAKQ